MEILTQAEAAGLVTKEGNKLRLHKGLVVYTTSKQDQLDLMLTYLNGAPHCVAHADGHEPYQLWIWFETEQMAWDWLFFSDTIRVKTKRFAKSPHTTEQLIPVPTSIDGTLQAIAYDHDAHLARYMAKVEALEATRPMEPEVVEITPDQKWTALPSTHRPFVEAGNAKVSDYDGMFLFPVRPRTKEIAGKFSIKNLGRSMDIPEGHNVGFCLRSRAPVDPILDVDFDWAEAADFAFLFERFGLPAPLVMRRKSKPVSHMLWSYSGQTASGRHRTIRGEDFSITKAEAEALGRKADEKNHVATVVEFRTDGWLMVPPSITEHGEAVEWEGDFRFPPMLTEEQFDQVRKIAHMVAFFAYLKALHGGVNRNIKSGWIGRICKNDLDLPLHVALEVFDRFYAGESLKEWNHEVSYIRRAYGGMTGGFGEAKTKAELGVSETAYITLSRWLAKLKPKQEGPKTPEGFFDRYRLIILQNQSIVVDTVTNKTQSKANFELIHGNIPCDDPLTGRKSSLGQAFFKSIMRHDYHGLVIEDPKTYDGDGYNILRPFAVKPADVAPPITDERIAPFFDHIKTMWCNGDVAVFEQVVDFIADMFQRPHMKGPVWAPVIKGPQRTGKSIVGAILRRILGDDLCITVNDLDQVVSGFNSHIIGKVFLGGEELQFIDDHKVARKMKDFLQAEQVLTNEKYGAVIPVKNITRCFLYANDEHPNHLDHDDSRYLILEVKPRWDRDTEAGERAAQAYFAPLVRMLQGEALDLLLAFFLKREVDYARLSRPLLTKAKHEQKIASDPVLELLDQIAETGIVPYDLFGHGTISFANARDELIQIANSYNGRNISQKTFSVGLKAVFGDDALERMTVRNAFYVDPRSGRRDEAGQFVYTVKDWQRGVRFPDLPTLRQVMSKKVGKQYPVEPDRYATFTVNTQAASSDETGDVTFDTVAAAVS